MMSCTFFFTAWEPRHVHADQPPQLKGMPKAHGFTCTNRGPIDNSKSTLNVPSNAYLTRSHVSKSTYCNETSMSARKKKCKNFTSCQGWAASICTRSPENFASVVRSDMIGIKCPRNAASFAFLQKQQALKIATSSEADS